MNIKGRTITLIERKKCGENDFGEPIYQETTKEVENVLIEPTSAEAVVQEQQLYGRHSSYILHIPKGNTDEWLNSKVILGGEFGNRIYKQFGDIRVFQEELLPLDWGKQVSFELYE